YGLTTLRHRHATVHGRHLTLDFRAKHGIEQHLELDDPRLARVVSRLEDLPGQRLFQYVDAEGVRHDIHSQDVNAYLQEITGADITAKDFRTWAATQLAAVTLCAFSQYDTKARAKKQLVEAVKSVAAKLGNTPAVCKRSYINPCILDGYLDGSLRKAFKSRAQDVLDHEGYGLTAEEAAVAGFLASRLPDLKSGPSS
ncbi:MAG: DNA topoisomerase IB, partial [Gluconobacter oxydans]